jgi:hypothetical protein
VGRFAFYDGSITFVSAKKVTMKTTLFLVAIFGLSFTPDSPTVTVSKIQGIDVYVYATPNGKYKVVDTGKIRVTLTGGCNEVVNAAVKKAAAAGADGVIVDLATSGMGNAWEAIKYE